MTAAKWPREQALKARRVRKQEKKPTAALRAEAAALGDHLGASSSHWQAGVA